jgi:Rrf2 family protein
LLQILRNLVTHGILQSTRGVVGGYSLAKPPGEISLLEIIEAVEGPIESTAPATTPLDSKAEAKLRQALDQVNETVRRGLSAILLEHLVKPSTVPPSHFGGALADRTAQQ